MKKPLGRLGFVGALALVGCSNSLGDAPAGGGVTPPATQDEGSASTPGDTNTENPVDTGEPGGNSIPPGLEGMLDPPLAPEGATPLASREAFAARLTRQQYANVIGDLLDVELAPDDLETIPPDATHEDAFVTWSGGQSFSTSHVEAYSALARRVAAEVDAAELFGAWSGCDEQSADCASEGIAAAGLRLYRRPLRTEEQESMESLFDVVESLDDATFADGADAVLRAMLQTPQFLYRLDDETLGTPGDSRRTTGFELASRLSFFLWQSMPDEELLALASQGPLEEADVEAQVERMMNDPRVERSLTTFWRDYTLASLASYPTVEPDVADDMRRTVVSTITRVAGVGVDEIPLPSLFTTTEMVLSPALAEMLGLEDIGEGDQVYDVSGSPQRMGILTHPGYLAGLGSTSFVGRGKAMSERILCRTIPSPPDAFAERLSEVAGLTNGETPRGASEFRFAQGSPCVDCHRTFEPIAMAFEQFDLQGRYTTEDDEGRDLFSTGYLQDVDGSSLGDVDDVTELMELLADRVETEECIAENLLSFASGLKASTADLGAIELASDQYQEDGQTFSGLVRAIATSPQLQSIKVAAAE